MLCVAVVECVLGTGVVFGFSALQLALAREGTYAELCEASGAGPGALASAGGCEAQKLRFAFVYSVATAAFQVSMMFWGCLLDLRGSAFVRVAQQLTCFMGGTHALSWRNPNGRGGSSPGCSSSPA